MTTALFFAPTQPQTAPSSFQCDRSDAFSSDPNSKTAAPGLSKDDKHENFLTTLKKVSRDQNSNAGSPSTGSPAKAPSAKTDLQPENDIEIDQESAADEILTDILSFLNHDASGIEDQTPMAAELRELITLLEALGWTGSSAEQQVMPGDGRTLENMSPPLAKYQDLFAAFKQMIGVLPSNDLKPGNELSTGLEHLRLLIARALTADASMPGTDVPRDGLNYRQSPVPVELANWAKGIIQGHDNPVSPNATLAVEGGGTEKAVDVSAVTTRIAADPDTVAKGPDILKTGEPYRTVFQPENPDKTDGSRLNPEMRVAAESDGSAKDPKVLDRLTVNGPIKDVENDMAVKPDNTNRKAPGGPSLLSAASGQRSGAEPVPENSLAGDTSGVSKAINEASAGKENFLKADTALSGDAVGKVTKPEAGTNDSGHLASQNQTSQRTIETTSAPKETEAAQRELRTQTMEQIVRRAVFQTKNGQQEARIDLKPDFLGHVRMQVITENQQVTVKILTEFGFVKDMIENNIQQLKADLQQQGLDVDKLDVSVSRDANGNKHHQENTQNAGRRSREEDSGDGDNTAEDRPDQKKRSTRQSEGLSTVDYFA